MSERQKRVSTLLQPRVQPYKGGGSKRSLGGGPRDLLEPPGGGNKHCLIIIHAEWNIS